PWKKSASSSTSPGSVSVRSKPRPCASCVTPPAVTTCAASSTTELSAPARTPGTRRAFLFPDLARYAHFLYPALPFLPILPPTPLERVITITRGRNHAAVCAARQSRQARSHHQYSCPGC